MLNNIVTNPTEIHVNSKNSLIHIGSLDSFDITKGGKEAAKNILLYLKRGDKEDLKRAIHIYEEIIPNENFGGEYTALEWICKYILSPERVKMDFMIHSEIENWYNYLSKNNYKNLKTYINYKYHFKEIENGDIESKRMLRFLEDFILFSNPDRNRWENTTKNFLKLDIEKNGVIADVGAGSGYFSFKFSDIVGDNGKVYAIETNPLHIDYLKKHIEKYGIKNIEVLNCSTETIGLPPEVKVDVVFMCSLYHVIYAALTEDERDKYIKSIINSLKPGGRFIIVDNNLVEDGDLPYHGPYISKELIISQLYYYGFKLLNEFQFTVQRYVLVFKYFGAKNLNENFTRNHKENVINVTSSASLVNYRIADAAPTAGFTENGRKAAKLFLSALNTKDKTLIEKCLNFYKSLMNKERIGDEYTAFLWFLNLLLLNESEKVEILKGDLEFEFFNLLGENDYALLKKYIKCKYELLEENEKPMDNLTQVSEYMTFNNPNRNMWEKTEKMLSYINITPGEVIADIGCGSGYFSYHFAKASGPNGKVYATEINSDALQFVENMKSKYNLNIVPIISYLNSVNLPKNSIDTIFMCSMYHAVYIASIEFVKDSFIESIKESLKHNGRLIIVDNDIQRKGVVPYFGSQIDKNLIISQLSHYGFKLIDSVNFIPQRYVLVFKMR